jgi:hypothetical protein
MPAVASTEAIIVFKSFIILGVDIKSPFPPPPNVVTVTSIASLFKRINAGLAES